jgi:GT2 family glycosyltransferase
MKKLSITVIIPTVWDKAEKYPLAALQSLEAALAGVATASRPTLRYVVFFNQSSQMSDQSNGLLQLQRRWQKQLQFPLEVMGSALNIGFTGGVNEAVGWVLGAANQPGSSQPDWLCVLNDDATVLPNFWQIFKKELHESQPAAVVSGGVQTMAGKVESLGLRYDPSGLAFPILDLGPQLSATKQPYFCGCYFFLHFAVARELWSIFGYILQPLFFAYSEDVELSLRLHRMGKNIVILPVLAVQHWGSLTAKKGSEFQLLHGFRNLLWTSYLHWSWMDWVKALPWVGLGQIYMLLLSWYKGYWWLYAKIWVSTYRHRLALQYVRHHYQNQLPLPSHFQ